MRKKATDTILAWDDDPGTPAQANQPVEHPRPTLGTGSLPVGVQGAAPTPGTPGTDAFRWWAAADAMARAADFWASVVPAGTKWNAAVGKTLKAYLDVGDDLNAYYDREGLKFFLHEGADGVTYHSGESPDVVCHELGHAVVDAVRPQLWDAASAEVAAFHESAADISAMLSALQLPAFRDQVRSDTRGHLARSSRLSRLAEQLGWAIRQVAPQAVDSDCLRNAANRWFYRDPLTLPPSAPATALSSEPHSFSRVFTGAYLRVIAAIFTATGSDSDALLQASRCAGQLLIIGVSQAPVTTGYYAQVAATVIAADESLNSGRHVAALKRAFQRHGILSPHAAAGLTSEVVAPHAAAFAAAAPIEADLSVVDIDGGILGVSGPVSVTIPAEAPRFAVSGAALAGGSVGPVEAAVTASGFVEDLVRNGSVAVPGDDEPERAVSHAIEVGSTGARLVRRLFDWPQQRFVDC